MLYHPHLGEIRPLMDQLCDKWPQLYTRAQRAEQILLNHDIVWCDGHWGVHSQSKDRLYIQEEGLCPCPDHSRDAPLIEDRRFCKHRIAVAAYLWILRQHLNEQPALNLTADMQLIDPHGVHVCQARIDADGHLKFESCANAHKFSRWLCSQPLLRLEVQSQTPHFSITSIEYSIVTA
ncbi:hypothetical protein KFU94_35595 [Chloroflexi bacterium TSY]|nr:hypothetical protein [Chloroflexi bacterium TSY]